LRISLACLGFTHFRFGPLDHRFLSTDSLIEINRVHFTDHLPGLDLVTHLHTQLSDSACCRGADFVGVASFDGADTEECRSNGAVFYGRHRDWNRCEWTRPQRYVDKKSQQGQEHRQQGQSTPL